MSSFNLAHLKLLEAESIHIIREVAAEFERPVMMYSIGKDSMVMVRLAQKAFHPAPVPFPLLHVDTTWKFREMIEFRNRYAATHGIEIIEHINKEGVDADINPFDYGSNKYTTVMKTEGLLQALGKYEFDCAFGGARRDEEKWEPLFVDEEILIEEWTYNLGPTRFMRFLIFENSRLADILTGDYGF